jgi:hypothetical protein
MNDIRLIVFVRSMIRFVHMITNKRQLIDRQIEDNDNETIGKREQYQIWLSIVYHPTDEYELWSEHNLIHINEIEECYCRFLNMYSTRSWTIRLIPIHRVLSDKIHGEKITTTTITIKSIRNEPTSNNINVCNCFAAEKQNKMNCLGTMNRHGLINYHERKRKQISIDSWQYRL